MLPKINIPVTNIFFRLLEMNKPLRIFEGSTRSGKTVQIVLGLVYLGMQEKLVIRIFRAVAADCRNTVGQDLLDYVDKYFPDIGEWQESKKLFTIKKTGTRIYLAGCDNEKRLHGYRQDIAYFNEIMECAYEAYNQVIARTTSMVLVDYNPSVTLHWFFEKVMKKDPDSYDYCHSTYKDNPFLSDFQVANIEEKEPTPENIKNGTADNWYWQVYGLGVKCKAEGAVYKKWKTSTFFPRREACAQYLYAIDWGFTVDPTTLVNLALCQNELYIREIFYRRELPVLRNQQFPEDECVQNFLEAYEIGKTDVIVCDRARQEHINDLCSLGYNAIPSFGNRIEDGIEKVQNFSLRPLFSSQHLCAELENYRFKEVVRMTQAGKKMLKVPVDDFNHCLDPVRYGVEYIHSNLNIAPIQEDQGLDLLGYFMSQAAMRLNARWH